MHNIIMYDTDVTEMDLELNHCTLISDTDQLEIIEKQIQNKGLNLVTPI